MAGVAEDIYEDATQNTMKAIGMDAVEDGTQKSIAQTAEEYYQQGKLIGAPISEEDAVIKSATKVLRDGGEISGNVTNSTLTDMSKEAEEQATKDEAADAAVKDGKQVARGIRPVAKNALKYGNKVMQGAMVVGLATGLLSMAFSGPGEDVGGGCTVQARDENDCDAIATYLGATDTPTFEKGACRISGGMINAKSCKNVRTSVFEGGMCKVTGSMMVDDRICFDPKDPCPPSSNKCIVCSHQTKCPKGTTCRSRVCEHLRNVAANGSLKKPLVQAMYANNACNLINVTKQQCDRLGVPEIVTVCQYGKNPKTLVPCKTDKDCTAADNGKCVASYSKGNKNPAADCLNPTKTCPLPISPEARWGTILWIVLGVLLLLVAAFFVVRRRSQK
jgi:hypothetical protein